MAMSEKAARISKSDTTSFERDGFTGHVYVPSEEGAGFNVLSVNVHGAHPRKQMLDDTTRTYYVLSGEGSFSINDTIYEVETGDLFVIPPDNEYEYSGQMQLLEVNVSPSNGFSDRKV
jgi:mannose-6-phosphate isomerase-like protein (cupin superfamily)